MRTNKTLSIDDATRERLRRLAEVMCTSQSGVVERLVAVASDTLDEESTS